jgi:2-C-methyl-D-erythritol 2,4-cyclodiphosphate synthase
LRVNYVNKSHYKWYNNKVKEVLMRIGFAKDIHRLVPDRPLILGGIKIPFHLGLLGHSDADVVLHAVSEAILGACGLGDLGTHFPDTDQRFEGIDSALILQQTARIMLNAGYQIGNVDISIHAEKPKLAPYIRDMRERIALLLECQMNHVNVKAGTNEGLDAIGRQEAIEAYAIVLLLPKEN